MAEIAMGLYESATYLEDLEHCAAKISGFVTLRGLTVLVTGATGLIGSFLVDVLLASGACVVAACRSQEKAHARFAGSPFGFPEFSHYDATLPIEGLPSADYVVHAASNAHPASMMDDPAGTVVSNVAGTAGLLKWCETVGVSRMLYVSSGEVYGRAEPGVASFSEEYQGYVDPLAPRSCYPVAKRAAENICASWPGRTECVVVRPCHTFGPTAVASDSRAASEFSHRAARGEDIVLRSKGSQYRSWLHVADAVSGMIAALFAGQPGKAYNVASSMVHATVSELAEAFAATSDSEVVYELEDQSGQTPITRQVLDTQRIEALGWAADWDIKEATSRTVRAMRESLEGNKRC